MWCSDVGTDTFLCSGQIAWAFRRLHFKPGEKHSVRLEMSLFRPLTQAKAIAYAELTKVDANGTPVHQDLIKQSIRDANWMFSKQADATLDELAVELMVRLKQLRSRPTLVANVRQMVRLALEIVPNLSGYSHIQTNPLWSYSTHKTVKNAESTCEHVGVSLILFIQAHFDRNCLPFQASGARL